MANHTKKTFKSESWVAHLNILFARCVGVGFAIVPLCYKENSDAKQWHTLDRVADERKTREIFGKVSFNGRRVYKWRPRCFGVWDAAIGGTVAVDLNGWPRIANGMPKSALMPTRTAETGERRPTEADPNVKGHWHKHRHRQANGGNFSGAVVVAYLHTANASQCVGVEQIFAYPPTVGAGGERVQPH